MLVSLCILEHLQEKQFDVIARGVKEQAVTRGGSRDDSSGVAGSSRLAAPSGVWFKRGGGSPKDAFSKMRKSWPYPLEARVCLGWTCLKSI